MRCGCVDHVHGDGEVPTRVPDWAKEMLPVTRQVFDQDETHQHGELMEAREDMIFITYSLLWLWGGARIVSRMNFELWCLVIIISRRS